MHECKLNTTGYDVTTYLFLIRLAFIIVHDSNSENKFFRIIIIKYDVEIITKASCDLLSNLQYLRRIQIKKLHSNNIIKYIAGLAKYKYKLINSQSISQPVQGQGHRHIHLLHSQFLVCHPLSVQLYSQ